VEIVAYKITDITERYSTRFSFN